MRPMSIGLVGFVGPVERCVASGNEEMEVSRVCRFRNQGCLAVLSIAWQVRQGRGRRANPKSSGLLVQAVVAGMFIGVLGIFGFVYGDPRDASSDGVGHGTAPQAEPGAAADGGGM